MSEVQMTLTKFEESSGDKKLECQICGAKRKNLSTHVRNLNDHPSWDKYKQMYPDTKAMLYVDNFVEAGKDTQFEEDDPRLLGKNNPNSDGSSMKGRTLTNEHRKKLSKQKQGKKNPQWVERETRTCEYCGEQFKVKKTSEQRFCSRECAFCGEKVGVKALNKWRENGGKPWNKGLTVEDDDRLRKTDEEIQYPSCNYSEELGHYVRSSWEEKIGLILKENNINYEYEPRRLEVGEHTYLPDFVLDDGNIILEVKGFLSDSKKERYQQLMEEYPEKTFIIVGNLGEESDEVCDIYIPWEKRNKLPNILKKVVSV